MPGVEALEESYDEAFWVCAGHADTLERRGIGGGPEKCTGGARPLVPVEHPKGSRVTVEADAAGSLAGARFEFRGEAAHSPAGASH